MGPACFAAIIFSVGVAIALFHRVSQNDFFLFYGEGKGNSSSVGSSSNSSSVDHDAEADSVSYARILSRSWAYVVTGYVNFATSLCVFPAITTLGESVTVLC